MCTLTLKMTFFFGCLKKQCTGTSHFASWSDIWKIMQIPIRASINRTDLDFVFMLPYVTIYHVSAQNITLMQINICYTTGTQKVTKIIESKCVNNLRGDVLKYILSS